MQMIRHSVWKCTQTLGNKRNVTMWQRCTSPDLYHVDIKPDCFLPFTVMHGLTWRIILHVTQILQHSKRNLILSDKSVATSAPCFSLPKCTTACMFGIVTLSVQEKLALSLNKRKDTAERKGTHASQESIHETSCKRKTKDAILFCWEKEKKTTCKNIKHLFKWRTRLSARRQLSSAGVKSHTSAGVKSHNQAASFQAANGNFQVSTFVSG